MEKLKRESEEIKYFFQERKTDGTYFKDGRNWRWMECDLTTYNKHKEKFGKFSVLKTKNLADYLLSLNL